jgi:NitT/TauT family transport system permease protein
MKQVGAFLQLRLPRLIAWPGTAIFRGREGGLFILGLFAIWQLRSSFVELPSHGLFPAPKETAVALWQSLPELIQGTWASLRIFAPGYLLAMLAGIFWGLLVGTCGWLQRAFSPFSRVAAPIPPTIYIPYAIALLPSFRLAAIFVVFIGAFWPIFVNTAAGAATTPQRHRDNARVLGLTYPAYLRRVVFPAALPHIFAGMSVALVLSFIMLTVAELFGAHRGLGRFVQYYADYGDYPRMVAGIIYTGLVAFGAMALLEAVKRRFLFWVR